VSVETLARDVFPAEVACPDGTVIRDVRVFATSHRVTAYGVVDGGIVKVLDEDLLEAGSIPATRSSLTGSGRLEARTSKGVFWVNRGRGCGCGGPTRVLKALGAPVSWTGERA
jgi:hypothetical protein